MTGTCRLPRRFLTSEELRPGRAGRCPPVPGDTKLSPASPSWIAAARSLERASQLLEAFDLTQGRPRAPQPHLFGEGEPPVRPVLAAERSGTNMDHLCLRIEPFDENALIAHLVSNGLAVGEIKSRFGADGYGPSLYISDPEGNVVELKGQPTRAGRN